MYQYENTSFYEAQHCFCLDKADVLKECFTNGTWKLFVFPFFKFPLKFSTEYTFLILSEIKFQI